MRLYVQGIEDFWTAMMVDEDEPPPPPGSLQGVCFFGKSPEEAKAAALGFYGRVEAVNWEATPPDGFSAPGVPVLLSGGDCG
jgi:hypothetical protein